MTNIDRTALRKLCEEAPNLRAALRRFINVAFRNPGDKPRFSIPARPDHDDDLVLSSALDTFSTAIPALLDENDDLASRLARAEGENERLKEQPISAYARTSAYEAGLADGCERSFQERTVLTKEVEALRSRISDLDCRYVGDIADTGGSHCPIATPCLRCRLERIQPALAELDVEKTHNRILRSSAAENAVKMEAAFARIAELEKALRPFVEAHDGALPYEDQQRIVAVNGTSWEDFVAAAAALGTTTKETPR